MESLFSKLNIPSEKDQFFKHFEDNLLISKDDFSKVETEIINIAFDMFRYKNEEIRTLETEIRRLNLELKNIKAMYRD